MKTEAAPCFLLVVVPAQPLFDYFLLWLLLGTGFSKRGSKEMKKELMM